MMMQTHIMKKFGTSWVLLALAAALSGALYFFSTGLTGFRPLLWIAPLPVLLVSMQYSRRAIMLGAFFAYALGGLTMAPHLAQLEPAGVVVISVVLPALAFSVIVVAYRDALVHLRHPLSFIAFPVGWTAYEYLLSAFSPHGTAGSIAYTQADFLALIQIASLTGIQGITFVVTLVPAGVAAAIHSRTRNEALRILAVVAVVGIGTLTYGWIRLATPASEKTFIEMKPGDGHTLYGFAGEWFSWLNLLILLILVAAVSRRLARKLSNTNS